MHSDNNKYSLLENEISKENEPLFIDSGLSSVKQRIIESQTKMSDSHKNNKINKIYQSNYSFSDKTIGNEISRTKTESLEQELLSFDKKPSKKSSKKEKPIFLSHSDYYYCPESKTEKNLNQQIMKYLYENNLIYKKKPIKDKKVQNIFNINYNNYQIKGDKKEPLTESKILQIILDNNLEEKKNFKKDNKLDNNIGNKIICTDILDYNIQKYLEQMQKCNNFNAQINQINNIKIKNIYITNNDNINKYGKSRNKISNDKIYNLKTEKIINSNEKNNMNKISFNKNLFRYNSSSKNSISSCKNKSQNKKNKNIINQKINQNKNIKINEFNKNKLNRAKNNMTNNYQKILEIDSNIVNEKIICNTNKNNISNMSNISLQSIEDSKLMLLADDIISKDKNIEIFDTKNKTFNKK